LIYLFFNFRQILKALKKKKKTKTKHQNTPHQNQQIKPTEPEQCGPAKQGWKAETAPGHADGVASRSRELWNSRSLHRGATHTSLTSEYLAYVKATLKEHN